MLRRGSTANAEWQKTKDGRRSFSRTIVLKDGTALTTLADVRAFILKEPEHIQERNSWQRAAELMIQAAEDGRQYRSCDRASRARIEAV
jgi:hypothetical protein